MRCVGEGWQSPRFQFANGDDGELPSDGAVLYNSRLRGFETVRVHEGESVYALPEREHIQ